MNVVLLFLAFINISVMLTILLVESKLNRGDTFSAGRVYAYFGILGCVPLFYFGLASTALDDIIFEQVNINYRSEDLVSIAYAFYALGAVVVYLGILIGIGFTGENNFLFFNKLIGLATFYKRSWSANRKVLIAGWLMTFVGFLIYLVFVYKMGGLVNIWLNLGQRQVLSAGLGYLQTFYMFTVTFGALLLASVYFDQRKYIRLSLLLVFNIFMLASIGQRGPVLALFFSLMLVYHYTVRRIDNLFTVRNFLLLFLLFVFFLASAQFRVSGALEKYSNSPIALFKDSIKTFERHIIARFGRLERDIVIIQYFSEHEAWLGAAYLSVLLAPVPRGFYEDKPPVDTGRYLVAMASGEIIDPPVPTNSLPIYGWPDGNMAGYMNFRFPGFFITHLLSGFFLGMIYSWMRHSRYSLNSVCLYAVFAWFGGVNFSPMGIVNILTSFLWYFIWSLLFRTRIRRTDCKNRILPST